MADQLEPLDPRRADGALTRADERVRPDQADAPRRSRPDIAESDEGGNGENGSDRGRPRKRWPLFLVAIIVIGLVIGGAWYYETTKNLVSTDDASTDGRAITVAPHVTGYATELLVNDNQRVTKGQLLVQIDPRDFIAARDQAEGTLKVALAQLDNARVNLETIRVTAPARLLAAQGAQAQAQATLTNAQLEYKRQHTVARAATTQQAVDQSTASQQSAQGQLAQADAQVTEAALVPQAIAQAEAQVAQLVGQVEQARAQLAQAELNLSWTRVTAPQDGWITKRNVEVGDLLASGQSTLSIVTPDLWVTANLKETQLDRVRPGQPVDIAVDAHPELNLHGHVDSIQMGSGAKFSAFPPENATGNFVKIVQRVPVKIVIDSGIDPSLPPLPLGLSVEPTINVK
jgi:membrane fusion protein (multidrug efflux system)